MKLFYSPNSPYVRKVMMAAIELGLADSLHKNAVTLSPYEPNPGVTAENPLGKIPVMVTTDCGTLFDSIVIAEYLSLQKEDTVLFPKDAVRRMTALTLNALADGMLEAAQLMRFESVRPENFRYDKWSEAQKAKLDRSFAYLEANLPDDFDIGAIALASTIGWLDFRFPDLHWREGAPRLADWFAQVALRDSFAKTNPPT